MLATLRCGWPCLGDMTVSYERALWFNEQRLRHAADPLGAPTPDREETEHTSDPRDVPHGAWRMTWTCGTLKRRTRVR
jgi:hypothetical protein